MERVPTVEPSHEDVANNPLEYPIEYFDAQIRFATKWAELSGDDIEQTLMTKTALGRRLGLTDGVDKDGNDISSLIDGESDPDEITQKLYKRYTSLESSLYVEKDLSSEGRKYFGYDYYPDNKQNNGRNTIKIHYENNSRGERSGLSKDQLADRQSELKKMVSSVIEEHPEAEEVIGGSWLYNMPAYVASFPDEFTDNMAVLVPRDLAEHYPDAIPMMAFSGNSVWGQFMDKHGWVNQERYDQLVSGVDVATTLVELFEAIPLKPLQPKSSPDVFINWDPAG